MSFQERLDASAEREREAALQEEKRRHALHAERVELTKLWSELGRDVCQALQGVRTSRVSVWLYKRSFPAALGQPHPLASREATGVAKVRKQKLWEVRCARYGAFFLSSDATGWAPQPVHGYPILLAFDDPLQTYVVHPERTNKTFAHLAPCTPLDAKVVEGRLAVTRSSRVTSQTRPLADIVADAVRIMTQG